MGKTILKSLHVLNVKTPYDSDNDVFRVSFIPSKSAEKVYIKIRIGADDDDKRNANVKSALCGENELEIKKGYIILNHVDKDTKVVLSVKLRNAKRCPLEVTAYAE